MSEIKDGIYGHVAGSVSKVFMYRDGMAITIDVKSPKKEFADKVTAWGIAGTIVSEGDRVKVKGWLSFTPTTYTKRDGTEGHGVNVALNKPEIIEHERLPGAKVAAPAVTAPVGDDTPF